MNRIEAIYTFIDSKDKVVDVGCDQAKLSIMLAKKGYSSIGSDISEKVISKAQNKIDKLKLNKYIDLRVSNGLEKIRKDEVDTLVLAGMGTFTILDILNNSMMRFDKIITISNNNHDILREKMNKLNYKVDSELIVYENNKYYNLIMFTPGNRIYNEYEVLLGLNHKDKESYEKYLSYLLKKYENIQKKSQNKNNKINRIINLIKSRV
ncbi:MAG: SAM-dependent methyltransferase [Tenericutes bacterium]|nr:SAM-dependent methyltransferase [Mycoplasmatota bacterium]